MIRVLHVLGGLNLGGAESRLMDLYRNIDRTRVQFDFLVHMDARGFGRAVRSGDFLSEHRTPQYYDDEVIVLGGHIYAIPRYNGYNHLSYCRAAEQFFAEHHDYNVVQAHMTSTASIYLPYARRYRSESAPYMVTVAHTRNAGTGSGVRGLAKKILRRSIPGTADYLFACSHLAGDETFGGAEYHYIPNTIDTDRFIYDPADRNLIRDMYGISDRTVLIGNVARFAPQKNQAFLIRAFAGMKNRDRAKLILCGEGSERVACETLAWELGVEGSVIFAGNQSEVWAYYSAMDIFAFPSEFEGMPGVVVEAQTSGLKCLISDRVTTDVMATDRIMPLGIEDSADWSRVLDGWIEEAEQAPADPGIRRSYATVMRDKGFDVRAQAAVMQRFYENPTDGSLLLGTVSGR